MGLNAARSHTPPASVFAASESVMRYAIGDNCHELQQFCPNRADN